MNDDLINLLTICKVPEGRIQEIIYHLDIDLSSDDTSCNLPLEVIRSLSLNYATFSNEIELLDQYISTKLHELTEYESAQYYHLKAFHLWKSGSDLFCVLHKLNRALQILQEVDSNECRSYMGKVCDTYARVLQNQGMYKDAVYEYNLALKYKELYDDDDSIALTYGNIGRLHLEMGHHRMASHFLKKDADHICTLASSVERQHILAKLYIGLAKCCIPLEQYSDAEKYIGLGYSINRTINNMYGSILTRIVHASLEIARGNPDKALEIIEETEMMLERTDEGMRGEFMGLLYKTKADYYGMINQPGLAYPLYRKAEPQYSEPSSQTDIIERAMFFLALARLTLAMRSHVEAAKYYRQSLVLLDITDDEVHRGEVEAELESKLPESWMLHNSGRFIGHRHVQNLLQLAGHEGFQGENKNVIILFSDIRDFTALSENFEPDKLVVFLNAYLASMTRCIEYYGGYVDKFIGDAIMGVFNLFDNEHNTIAQLAERALLAALMMQEEIIRFNMTLPINVPKFRVGIGMHYGEVVSGLIGSAQKRSYTVIGDTVNIASRIEGLTRTVYHKVLISNDLKSLLPESKDFDIKYIGNHKVKGKTRKIAVYSVFPR